MPKRELVCVFSFLSRKSLEIRKWLQNAIEITLLNCKLKVIYKSPSKIANHFHFKNWKLRFGFVYSFKCNNCNAIYYGKKTKKNKKMLFLRQTAELMWISHLTNKRLENVKQPAFSGYLLTCDCNMNFNDFTILSKDSNNINLLMKESLLISRDKPILNKTVKSFPLELFDWQNLIDV